MLDATRTTTALLAGLCDHGNEAAWAVFDARYRPIVMGLLRQLGLGDADAADAAQEAVLEFMRAYEAGRYDRERGRLRSWLLSIARTKAALVHRRRAAKKEVAGVSAMVDLDDEDALDRAWDQERRRALLRAALEELESSSRLDPRTLRAFELLVVRGMPVPEVAAALEMSAQSVYMAKSRLAERLREVLDRLERTWDDDAP